MTLGGGPAGPTLAGMVAWAAGHLGLPDLAADTLRDLDPSGAQARGEAHDFCWPLLHEASGGTRACVPTAPAPSGAFRVSLPVPDVDTLARCRDRLAAAGLPPAIVGRVTDVAPLLTSPRSLRLVVDHGPGDAWLAGRLGWEVAIDPAIYDLAPVLVRLGVPSSQLDAMMAVVGRLPAEPVVGALPGLCGEILLCHLSLAWPDVRRWPDVPPVLTSHLRVRVGPPATSGGRRDEAVAREGLSWPQRLAWAVRQLPLRQPEPRDLEALARWRDAVAGAGGDEDVLLARLGRDGLDRDRALVAVSRRTRSDQDPAPWWDWYQLVVGAIHAFPVPGESPADMLARVEADLPPGAGVRTPFAHLLWPGVTAAWARFAAAHPDLVAGLSPRAGEDLRRDLLSRLSAPATPTLVHQMWHSVPYGQRVLAGLGIPPAPASGAGRYADACAAWAADGLSEVLVGHPVLGGLLGRAALAWDDAVAEMLSRVAADRPALAATLGIPADQPVTAVRSSAGDTHRGGRTVAILEVGGARLVYKPRSVALEALYRDAAHALSGQPGQDPLRAARVLACTDAHGQEYGYMEFVNPRPAGSPAELAAFYRNAGRTLAVLHALGATDCHHENMVACADQLVPIDAETLLEGLGRPDDPGTGLEPTDSASVLRIGVLPSWMWLDGQRRAVDITAMGVSRQPPPTSTTGEPAINTDAMIGGPRPATGAHPGSLPTPPGAPGRLAEHVEGLVEGFTEAYRVLAAAADGWLGQVFRAAPASRRSVLRPTYVYASLLGASLDPRVLESASARGMVLEKLARAHLGAEGGATWPLVAAEQEALAGMDIPYFEAPLDGGQTLWRGGSLQGWPALADSPTVESLLGRMGEADLQVQVSLIRGAVAVSALRPGPQRNGAAVAPRPDPPTPEEAARVWMSRVRAAARPMAHPSGPPQLWWRSAVMLPDGQRANLAPLGLGLYDGALGLAVALHERADGAPGEPDADAARATADVALARLLAVLDGRETGQGARLATAMGWGMAGVGGLLRGVAHLREHDHLDPETARRCEQVLLAGLTPRALAGDVAVDHIAGVAGLIGPLVALYPTHPDVAELVAAAADALWAAQDRRTGAWTTLPGDAPLTGLAHGASGIALALARAGRALGVQGYLDAAVRGLQYEASTFDEAVGNWPDFRRHTSDGATPAPEHRFMMGWCAGAPGIALARIALLDLLPDHPGAPGWRAQLRAAATATAAAPLQDRDHLCCGNLGRVVVLREISRHLTDPQWDAAADRIVAQVLARPEGDCPRTILGSDPGGIVIPGLMTGLPGAALALVPSSARWVSGLLV